MIKVHKFALAIPQMTEVEFNELKEDLKLHGQRVPITIYQGLILDGIHRDRAMRELGLEAESEEFIGTDLEAAELVVSLNIKRRHLTVGQRNAIVVDTVLPEIEKAAKNSEAARKSDFSKNKKVRKEGPIHTGKEVAKLAGTSEASVNQSIKLKKESPKLYKEVASGKKSLGKAIKELPSRRVKDRTDKNLTTEQWEKRRVEVTAKVQKRIEQLIDDIEVEISGVLWPKELKLKMEGPYKKSDVMKLKKILLHMEKYVR